jgi:hypothetical protein
VTKPHVKLKQQEPYAMANDVVPAANRLGLPAHLVGKSKDVSWGEIDRSQQMLPRVKLMQASSPEVADYPGQAIAGEFWHTTLTASLGPEVTAVPIMRRQTYNLWAPRTPGEDRGILARARDFIHWEPPDGVWQVRYPMNPKTYTWRTARTVKESGLAEWGSSRDDDPNSRPAAQLTFEVLWYLPDYDTLVLTLNSRSGVKEARKLFAMVDAKPTNPFYQLYTICAVRNVGPTGETYYGYKYRGAGYVSEQLGAKTAKLFEDWKNVAFASADEGEDEPDEADRGPPQTARTYSREAPHAAPPIGRAGVIDEDIPF